MPKGKLIYGPRADEVRDVEMRTLEEMQAAVHGWIEALAFDGVTAYVNEEGKYRSDLAVTRLIVDSRGVVRDGVVGPILLFGPPDKNGQTTDLTPEALAIAEKHLKPIVKDAQIVVLQ